MTPTLPRNNRSGAPKPEKSMMLKIDMQKLFPIVLVHFSHYFGTN